MSYNLILNSKLENDCNWKLINCTLNNGILTSSKKVFGIEQELVLSNLSQLYFRTKYKAFCNLKEVKIGIQNGDILEINYQIPKLNKLQTMSLTDVAQQNKIKLHIIFESENDINRVMIQEPILVDLNYLNKSTWIKSLLDRTIKYRNGYQYYNEYCSGEITAKLNDFKNIKVENAKTGLIIKTMENIEIPLTAKFIVGHYYLVKLNFSEINRFGKINLTYGNLKANVLTNDQAYLVFKVDNLNKLKLNIDSNDVIEYKINLKHLMVIDITKMNLLKEDILYLPFI